MNIINLNEYYKLKTDIGSFHTDILKIPTITKSQKELYEFWPFNTFNRQTGVTTGLLVIALHELFFNNDYKILHLSRKYDIAQSSKNKFLEFFLNSIKHPLFSDFNDYSIKENLIRMINRSHIIFSNQAMVKNMRGLSYNLILCDEWEYYDDRADFEISITPLSNKIIRASTKE